MPYPPTIPPTGRVNATPQVDNHPSDHNAISVALTDIVNELGNDPSGASPTVQARFDAIPFIQAGSIVITTDASGNATFGFPVSYRVGTVPVVLVCGANPGYQEMIFTISSPNRSACFVRVYNTNTKLPAPAGLSFAISWVAIGLA